MATPFRTNFDETYPFSDTGAKARLAAGVELTWTVPGTQDKKYRARFSYPSTAEIWVKLNGTVTVPLAGTVVDMANEEFLPKQLYVNGGDVIHFISTGTPQFGISLLQLPG